MEKIIDRLNYYIESKGISLNSFDKSMGLSNGYIGKQIKNKASIGGDVLEKISCTYIDLSIEWLITGKGKMLRSFYSPPEIIVNEEKPAGYGGCEKCKMKDEIIASLKRQVKTLDKLMRHMETEKSSNEDEQKRKAAS